MEGIVVRSKSKGVGSSLKEGQCLWPVSIRSVDIRARPVSVSLDWRLVLFQIMNISSRHSRGMEVNPEAGLDAAIVDQ